MSVMTQRSGIQRRRWTAKELYRLLDLGFFAGQRVELIEGEILQMASQKNYHAIGIGLGEEELRAAFGPGFWVRVQMSLDLSPYSVPDPDLAVIRGSVRAQNKKKNPRSALLIVEVSDTTLRFDRTNKGSLYAKAGIKDYWILNLVDEQLEVYRNPQPDPSQPYGWGYEDVTVLKAREHVSPLARPRARIAVRDLLP